MDVRDAIINEDGMNEDGLNDVDEQVCSKRPGRLGVRSSKKKKKE